MFYASTDTRLQASRKWDMSGPGIVLSAESPCPSAEILINTTNLIRQWIHVITDKKGMAATLH